MTPPRPALPGAAALSLQPNERHAHAAATRVSHSLDLPVCCPVTKNPRPGSTVTLSYTAGAAFLEVAALFAFVQSYVGGRGAVRSMEGLVQSLAQECANALGVPVTADATLDLEPSQIMNVVVTASPRTPEARP